MVRLGESRERPIDISLLCASNRGLPDLIARGLFRQDLYYRINGLCVTLPPLRERSNVLDIAAFFLARRGRPGHAVSLSEAARKLVLRHSWPGNLRELDHAMTVATAFLDRGPRRLAAGALSGRLSAARTRGAAGEVYRQNTGNARRGGLGPD